MLEKEMQTSKLVMEAEGKEMCMGITDEDGRSILALLL